MDLVSAGIGGERRRLLLLYVICSLAPPITTSSQVTTKPKGSSLAKIGRLIVDGRYSQYIMYTRRNSPGNDDAFASLYCIPSVPKKG